MKYFILCVCLLVCIFSYSQNSIDSFVVFVFKGERFNPVLAIARITNSKDTIFLKNLKVGTYKVNKTNGQVYFTVDDKGLINGKSYLVNKTNTDLDSLSYESKSSRLIKFEKYINGELSLSSVFTTNLVTIKSYEADGSLFYIQYDTLIDGEAKSIRSYYQNDGKKHIVYDGVKNVDSTFFPDGKIATIESNKYKFKKVYNLFGRLVQHEYVKYVNEKKGLYEKYEDFYKNNEVYKRIIKRNDNNEVTTINFKDGVISRKEVISIIQKGNVIERTKIVYDNDGKIVFQNKTSEPVSSIIVN